MTPHTSATYGLLALLAIVLLAAAVGDWRHRLIRNRLNATIAAGAPLFWLAIGMEPWPGMALQLGLALLVLAICAALFALRMLGGGDAKLLAALALWVPPPAFAELVLVMALAGGVLAAVMLIGGPRLAANRPAGLPYGIAIAAGGLWVLPTLSA
ncbi:A24 family peptidase [Croceibacterium ferulae]|uniref:A24 family peptidase n=1 Tax=Croceibacterium ferulae TaxID=1854641 RepID=UPI000EAFF340|nr:prepilin peptidase [Croceibacterium ferulae]